MQRRHVTAVTLRHSAVRNFEAFREPRIEFYLPFVRERNRVRKIDSIIGERVPPLRLQTLTVIPEQHDRVEVDIQELPPHAPVPRPRAGYAVEHPVVAHPQRPRYPPHERVAAVLDVALVPPGGGDGRVALPVLQPHAVGAGNPGPLRLPPPLPVDVAPAPPERVGVPPGAPRRDDRVVEHHGDAEGEDREGGDAQSPPQGEADGLQGHARPQRRAHSGDSCSGREAGSMASCRFFLSTVNNRLRSLVGGRRSSSELQ